MGAPQIIAIVLMAIGLVLELILHGETTTRKHNFIVDLIGKMVWVALLYWGGFWH